METERPRRSLDYLSHVVMDVFTGTGITVILHDRVYISIARFARFPGNT